jgi:hypothetical protein
MRDLIRIVENALEPMLYHGTSRAKLRGILTMGVTAPSYWGTREEAERYNDGVMLAVPLGQFDPDGLMVNDLLVASMREDGEDVEEPSDWRESLEVLGSVRYDFTIHITEGNIL